ncbi:FYN-binding protein 2 isoform X4 [Meles meles]|uniref:FYN-binding protein 2 isoform X4 n=1 Tax=Meles meles TaxID=9662 RepID=UPI001E69F045|nr:FYN-binding protein 2 isoform X4 [Meles meles]
MKGCFRDLPQPQRFVLTHWVLEGLRNFKELRAKFQKFDMPLPPGHIKFSAGVSQKGGIGNARSTRIVANGKPLSSNHSSLPLRSSAESQLLKDQETKLAQRNEIQKCSNSPGPPESSPGPAVNSQKSSPLLDRKPSNAEITNKRRVTVNDSFKDKLWNWEKFSSQKSSEKQSVDKHQQLLKTKPLPSIESLGPPPPKPPKPPVVNLQAFQRQAAAISKTHTEAAVEEGCLPPESAEFEEPHNYEATISYLKHSGNSINLCTAKEIADSTYEVKIEEPRKPWKNGLHQELSPKHEDEDKKEKEKEPGELEPQKPEKDLPSSHLFKGATRGGMLGRKQVMKVLGGRRSMLPRKQGPVSDATQTKACLQDPKLARHSLGHCGYVEALGVTTEMPGEGACKPHSNSEETYDDVEYPGRAGPQSDLSNSFASDNEENNEEMYEEVYKTKSNYPKIDLDGKEALKRLRKFFKKEKDRFKMKKNKLKENVSAFSISLPDLELRSQEAIIYDNVEINEKESRDENKLKTWKPKFLMAKEKKERKGAEESERNFFRTKKQILEKMRMEKEEKRFREQFEYDKEITVINTAVACSSNSRNGIFDLPITPGEELQVIDTTEENLVICRNSKGKYGYVLIEHLDFKHQGWSP